MTSATTSHSRQRAAACGCSRGSCAAASRALRGLAQTDAGAIDPLRRRAIAVAADAPALPDTVGATRRASSSPSLPIPSPPASSSSRATSRSSAARACRRPKPTSTSPTRSGKPKEYEKAAESYLAAVEVYRSVDGPFTPLAIGPLTSLGDNYHEADDDVNAVAAYSEARTVSRRAYGLHNEEQIELLDRMSRSLLDLNQLSEAEAQQVEALRLVQRANPPGSDAVLEAIYKYAEWLGDRLLFQLQRDQYARALRMIRQAHGEQRRQAGRTAARDRQHVSRGAQSREHGHLGARGSARICCSSSRSATPSRRPCALRDIGDWAVAFGKTGYSGTEYQRAWQMLGSAPNGDELRREWFTGANYVLYEPISPRGLSTDPEPLSGHVTVSVRHRHRPATPTT